MNYELCHPAPDARSPESGMNIQGIAGQARNDIKIHNS